MELLLLLILRTKETGLLSRYIDLIRSGVQKFLFRVTIGSKFPLFWVQDSLISSEYKGLFPGADVGWAIKGTNHLQLMPRSIKHGSIYPSPYVFMAQCLIKHRHNFTF
jgi:hypothetical protein